MFLVLSGFGVYIYVSLSTQLLGTLDDSLRLSAEQILPTLENENGRLVFGHNDNQAVSLLKQDDLLRLVTPTGEVLAARGPAGHVPIPAASITGGGGLFAVTYPGTKSAQGQRQDQQGNHDTQDSTRLLSVPVMVNDQIVEYLQVGRSLESIQDTLRRLLTLLLIAGPAPASIPSTYHICSSASIAWTKPGLAPAVAAVSASPLPRRSHAPTAAISP